jgi:hypothetical protein
MEKFQNQPKVMYQRESKNELLNLLLSRLISLRYFVIPFTLDGK